MAENEKKTTEVAEVKAEKPAKDTKKEVSKKKDKPSLGSRILAWCRTTKAELKKIVWTPKKTVLKNTAVTLVGAVALSIIIGILDYLFSSAIVGLSLIL